jgi:hypothetical protein
MQRLRQKVLDQNSYRWAGQILSSGARLTEAAACV